MFFIHLFTSEAPCIYLYMYPHYHFQYISPLCQKTGGQQGLDFFQKRHPHPLPVCITRAHHFFSYKYMHTHAHITTLFFLVSPFFSLFPLSPLSFHPSFLVCIHTPRTHLHSLTHSVAAAAVVTAAAGVPSFVPCVCECACAQKFIFLEPATAF
jgi:hypothetical protein